MGPVITYSQARLLYRQHFPDESAVELQARELPGAWYFPRCFIGSCGLVIDKSDGHLHVFGSAFPLETWLWAYERGFRYDTYDLVIPEVQDLGAAVTILEELGLRHPGFAYLPQRTYTREQLTGQLSRPPARFVNQKLWTHYEHLRNLEAQGLPFHFVVEADTHSIAPPGTPALLLSPSVLMPLAHDEARRQSLLRRRDRGELDVIVRAEDFDAAEGNLSRQVREARRAARGSERALQADLAALRSLPCRRAGEPLRPGEEMIWGAAPIPPEARLITDLADLPDEGSDDSAGCVQPLRPGEPAMHLEIRFLDATEAASHLDSLVDLLRDSVDNGASVGFLPPLETAEARAYWEGVIADLSPASRSLAVAIVDGRIAGTAQLVSAGKANARHRAEVSKVLVHSAFRRRGLGAALMRAIEERARELRKSTLVLDTLEGEPSEQLYQSLGWIRVGVIPQYAEHKGALEGTVVYYKLLGGSGR